MKRILLLLFALGLAASPAQSQSPTPTQPPAKNPSVGPNPTEPPLAPNGAVRVDPNAFFNTNKFNFDTNKAVSPTNAANQPGETIALPDGTLVAPSNQVTLNFSITNTLSAMSPIQVNNVIQVQVGLNQLQSVLVHSGGQNMQVVLRSPQTQQQVQLVATRISTLAVGTIKPSADVVLRLSRDLTSAMAVAQVPPDRLLVLSVVINQVVNAQALRSGQIEEVINTGVAALQSSGAPMSVTHLAACDLHAIAFEVNPNLVM